jgi:predicted phosphate transport protein (TIGR00153 family)
MKQYSGEEGNSNNLKEATTTTASSPKTVSSEIVTQIETSKTTRSHLRVLALSGAGVFMDGYDLFIISVALIPIRVAFHTTPLDISAISSAAILGAVFGAVIFGNLADRLGRKTLYVIDLIFFVVFGALSAFSQSIIQLVVFRFLLGIGIGADYPISASYIAEFVSNKNRGKLIASVFAFQGLGILSAIGVSIYFLTLGPYILEPWRWMLLSGVVPAIVALTLRTTMPETPRWYMSHGQTEKAKEVMSKFFGYNVTEEQLTNVVEKVSVKELLLSPYARRVFFTSASWFLVDVGVYGIGLLLPTFIQSIYGPNSPALASAITTGILYIFAGFGYLSSIALIDVVGRKWIQTIGFFGMAIPLAIAAFYSSSLSFSTLLFLLGVFYILENMGPNTTTFVYPVELFPTRLRGTGHGIAATVGKVGALVSAFFLPLVLLAIGKAEMLAIVSAACFVGGGLTLIMGTETKKLSLEDVSEIFKSFYDTFDRISENVLLAAEQFSGALSSAVSSKEGKIDSTELAQKIKLLEHEGDNLVHDAFTKLAKRFVAPIDRQDITALLKALDDMLDFIDATTSRMQIYHVERVTPEMVQFSKIILSQAQAIRDAILSLKGSKAEITIGNAAIKIDDLENQADSLLHESLGKLFEVEETGSTAFRVMKIKEIYEYLETTTDKAEDVADVLRNLIIKYSL